MTWLIWLGSSQQHAVEGRRVEGVYTTLCGLTFPYEPVDDPAALRREPCAKCYRLAHANQLTLWDDHA